MARHIWQIGGTMPSSQGHLLQTDAVQQSHGRLSDLASKALSEVATREASTIICHNFSNAPFVDRILNAAMQRSGETLDAAAKCTMAQGVPAEVIIDDIVPRAARMMGEEWAKDASCFASVTLGAFRLQSLVRELSLSWTADAASLAQSTVLLWAPVSTQHTLGATVVSTQLRRMGHSVQFVPGLDIAELKHLLAVGSYDGVVVSASMSDKPEEVNAIVDTAKAYNDKLPIVVGGTIVKQYSDLTSMTGADIATSDIEHASHFLSVAQ